MKTLLFLASLTLTTPALAALGDQLATPASGQRVLSAVTSGNYTQRETVDGTGLHLREYVTSAGIVFAVAWNGPAMPNLQQIFGSSYSSFQSAAQARSSLNALGHRASGDLEVETGGHMGAYVGRAWLKSRLPDGFDTTSIQ
ncbi:DUF2844 domain-containing protein [Paludibacterium yongneupense]|uniref:DUF2844 domain-containing protein n=1 Tax=Paludibacterium yongneupense TaxID=400061 RepID=UPI0004294BDF|nr:DUF2844 domain-containing protein [Paludibacterium yongneupense]